MATQATQNNSGIIYLIKFKDIMNQTKYKIGKSKNISNRLKTYHYAEILHLSKSNNITQDENKLIALFSNTFALDKGREFFISNDENKVIQTFIYFFIDSMTLNNTANTTTSNTITNTPITYKYSNEEYQIYKKSLLGIEPQRSDKYTDYYYLEDREMVKSFVLRIKPYGNNLKMDEQHISKIKNDLLAEAEPQLFGNIAIIEYTDYETEQLTNLIELIDGHHRIEALKALFSDVNDIRCKKFTISIWIALHKSDTPRSDKTQTIFKKYNNLKPFIVDLTVLEVVNHIIDEMKIKYYTIGYSVIKDSQYVNRPAIKQNVLNDILQKELEKYKKNKQLASYENININLFLNELYKINDTLASNDLVWFNNNAINDKTLKPITENIYKNAKKYNFYLALVNLQNIIANILMSM